MQVKDPRLGMVTITDVRVTGDLHDATVFYTVLGDEREHADVAPPRWSRPAGVLRSEVGRQTGVRFTPDAGVRAGLAARRTAQHIDELLAVAAQADAAGRAGPRQGAQPAGDPDPYRKPPGREPTPMD